VHVAPDVSTGEKSQSWAHTARTTALIATTVYATLLGAGLCRDRFLDGAYFWRNAVPDELRRELLTWVVVATAVASLLTLAWTSWEGKKASTTARSWRFARRVSPLGPMALMPCLLNWELWQRHDLTFLSLALADSLALGAAVTAAVRAGPTPLEARVIARMTASRVFQGIARVTAHRLFWMGVVGAAAAAYAAWFSYHTVVWHLSVRSGYDLAIQDNILWNLLHGGPFFKAAPTLGPTGSHFGRHATLVSYLLLPFYGLHPSASTLLVLQSTLMGGAAVPLFLFARRQLGDVGGAVVALAYLLHPALQQSNLFEFHYVKLGLPFFYTSVWLLDAGRRRWALVAAGLTLLVREDVATWVVLLGLWGLLSGRSPRTGLVMAVAGGVYVAVIKFVVMPAFSSGGDQLLFMYQGLLPEGKSSFGWVMATALANPGFALKKVVELDKLIYALQLLVPLALIPLRRSVGWFALLPAAIYCLLSTRYRPLIDIHYQYSAHFLAFVFPALALVMRAVESRASEQSAAKHASENDDPALAPAIVARERSAVRRGALAALIAATLVCSYQYGATLQQHTSRGGPVPYRFGWDEEGRERQQALAELLQVIPPQARVTASAFLVSQISARPDGYSLSLGLYDAEWLLAPTVASEYVAKELQRTRQALSSGWGVVAIAEPFFVARKGHSSELNRDVLAALAGRGGRGRPKSRAQRSRR
jgi:uncharacterized membrane protein